MAVKNSLVDVHNMLIEQMERLADAETPEEVESACRVASSMEKIGKVVVENARVILDAQKTALEYGEKAPNNGIFAIGYNEGK